MDTTEHLRALGEETLYMESLFLSLKIEKELKADKFTRDKLLAMAESLWKEITQEYHSFLRFLQDNHPHAA